MSKKIYPEEYTYPVIYERVSEPLYEGVTKSWNEGNFVTFPDFNVRFYLSFGELPHYSLMTLIEDYALNNKPLPKPSSYEEIKANTKIGQVKMLTADIKYSDILMYANNKGVRVCDLSREEIWQLKPGYDFDAKLYKKLYNE